MTTNPSMVGLERQARPEPEVDRKVDVGSALIRFLVGFVFVSEGAQKFIFPGEVGAGRFERIGIPSPELMGPLVGAVEIACGLLVLLGLWTRVAVIPLLVVMAVALITTKLPILLATEIGPFALRDLPYYGFWGAAHESRTDLAMVVCSVFLLLVGGGRYSVGDPLSRAGRRGKGDAR